MAGLVSRLVRFFYKHFYNRLAFTYDPVSTLVSRGEWRAWVRAAIPFLRGPRILEVACGTGNLELDLHSAGFDPVAIDLSPNMLTITHEKLRSAGLPTRLIRSRVQFLPFPDALFDSLVMTFPPGFAFDPAAMNELRRVLSPSGHLVWVDAPRLLCGDPWSRFLNWAYRFANGDPPLPAGGSTLPSARHNSLPIDPWLPREGWSWQIEHIERPASEVHVLIGTKGQDR